MQTPELLDWVYWQGELYQVRDRTRNKMTKAITLYLCNCQQSVCYHLKERVPLEDCKPAIAHIRKPDWSGYIHSVPWGLEGICADVMWVEFLLNPEAEEFLLLPNMPQRYPFKDLIKLQGKLDKSLCGRQQNDIAKRNHFLFLKDAA